MSENDKYKLILGSYSGRKLHLIMHRLHKLCRILTVKYQRKNVYHGSSLD